MTGLAVGFVLGAKAGRERYEQMMKLARKAAESPAVQQATTTLRTQAAGAAKMAGGKLADRAGSAGAKLGKRVPGLRTRDSNGKAHAPRRGGYAAAPGERSDQQGG